MKTITSEDKLIMNLELLHSVRSYIRQRKASSEIIAKIEELLKGGADINACDGNDSNNTILHIAVQKEVKDVVIYLLQKGGPLLSTESKKKALTLALQKNTNVGKEITEYLYHQGISLHHTVDKNFNKQQINLEDHQNQKVDILRSDSNYTFRKRDGTSGVSGQFYETKLLSLVLHRALHDKDIKEFYLASNIEGIGNFDDVCFRYENCAFFMQCKHRENTGKGKLTVDQIRSSTGKLGLGIYFESFLKIRQKFFLSSDPMFQGNFDETNNYFIFYTPVGADLKKKLKENEPICSKIHNIIYTRERKRNETAESTDVFQFDFDDIDVDLLTNFIKDRDLKILGKTFIQFILSNTLDMMTSELVRIYHPALAQSVIRITRRDLKNTYILIGQFRNDFFDSENFYLKKLKYIFYKEIIFNQSSVTKLKKEELEPKIQDVINNTCTETISELIGSPIIFDDTLKRLCLDNTKVPKNMFTKKEITQINNYLQNVPVTKAMIEEAVCLAGKNKLETLTFQLPMTFGNTDIQIKTKKGLSRLDVLAEKFRGLIEYYGKNKYIIINSDVICHKILDLNNLNSYGIGGLVGNLLEFDMQNELFIFNTSLIQDELPENAKYIRDKIKELVGDDLSSYKFKVMIDGFPRTSFDVYQYDKDIARSFLGKLWFYTNQAQEESVEAIVKDEINIHYNSDVQRNRFLFHVHTDAIFLRFHDKVQKWWKRSIETEYLTKNTTIYEESKNDIVDRPILTVLTLMFMRNIEALGIEFSTSATDNLNLEEIMSNRYKLLNIVTDAKILSAAKILQCKKYQNHCTIIGLDYFHILSNEEQDAITEELELLKDILVIITDTPINRKLQDTLVKILSAFTKGCMTLEKHIIIVTSEIIHIKLDDYEFITLKDENVNLTELTTQSKTFILDTNEVIYQGHKLLLNKIVDDTSLKLVNAKLLSSLLNKETIEIGQTIESPNYNEIKNNYVSRSLEHNGEDCVINTLYDTDDEIVLISSKPRMGKTVLLTHLSLETKQIDPKVWIVNVDMASTINDLLELRKYSMQNVMELLLKVALKNTDDVEKVMYIEINDEKVIINSNDIENISFELKLFMHFYNEGNVIFLFDGFDKVYPRYTNEAFSLFTTLKKARKRMWVTSDSYAIKNHAEMFGSPYRLKSLANSEKGLLDRFWSINLKLEKLNYEQYNNIKIYVDYILNCFNLKFIIEDVNDRHIVGLLSGALHFIYLKLLDHFKDEAHSLSWIYIREKIKKYYNVQSYTGFDRYLQNLSESETAQLKGIPALKYIVENYFILTIGGKFDLQLNRDIIVKRAKVYLNSFTLYKLYLITNIKKACQNKTALFNTQLRNDFFKDHKKLALYTIYKEKDISELLTLSEISEIEQSFNKLETSELKTDSIDTVAYNVPHLIFVEYYFVETVIDLLPNIINGDFSNLKLDPVWNFIVNLVLAIGPPALRETFKYKLKYDSKTNSSENCNRLQFDLILREHNFFFTDTDDVVDTAINEGLSNIINILITGVLRNLSKDSKQILINFIQKSIPSLQNLDISQSVLSKIVFESIEDLDGETIVNILNLFKIGHNITEKIKEIIAEPLKRIAKKIVELSKNNKNIISLTEELPRHLPQFIPAISNILKVITNTTLRV